MKSLINALLLVSGLITVFGTSQADEELLNHIEDAQIIINISSSKNSETGHLLVLPCNSCESLRFSFDGSTKFYLKGIRIKAGDIGNKISRHGMIMFYPEQPTLAKKVLLN
ncbi:hypothetical protein D3C81_1719310 [compost metagenome]